jgi:hypothetical protein
MLMRHEFSITETRPRSSSTVISLEVHFDPAKFLSVLFWDIVLCVRVDDIVEVLPDSEIVIIKALDRPSYLNSKFVRRSLIKFNFEILCLRTDWSDSACKKAIFDVDIGTPICFLNPNYISTALS